MYVGNLPLTAKQGEICDTFNAFGDVTRVLMNKGFAHVDFRDAAGARNVVAACQVCI